MPTFTSFNNRLPDPTFSVDDSGAATLAGRSGPGFASVQVTSVRPVQVNRTNSGRGVHRSTDSHHWEINITYNPMLRDDFDVVSSFLDRRNGRLNPFFVVLPQNSKPKDPLFAAFAENNVFKPTNGVLAGATKLTIGCANQLVGTPKPGDFFTLKDPADVTHLKVYKVTAVETNENYQQGTVQPALNQVRIHTLPEISKFTSADSVVNWINPEFRVALKTDVQEYSLSTDNLYQFGLSLEEIHA